MRISDLEIQPAEVVPEHQVKERQHPAYEKADALFASGQGLRISIPDKVQRDRVIRNLRLHVYTKFKKSIRIRVHGSVVHAQLKNKAYFLNPPNPSANNPR